MHIQKRLTNTIIWIILLTAALIRVWGIDYDLPYIYHPDEPVYIAIIQNIFKTGDLNPHFFNYPSLFFYINAIFYIPYYLFGKIIGAFLSPNDILPPISLAMGTSKAQMPSSVLLGRFVTVCFGVGTVYLTYIVGKQIGNKAVGILASMLVAISPTNVWHSRIITPDTFVTFFALASLLSIILVYQHGRIRDYIVAGINIGLTLSSKYNGGLIILSFLVAHFLRYGRMAFKEPKLYLSLLFCGLGFFATTPYAILDSAKFISDLQFEARHYSTGHAGMEGNTLKWYLEYMWKTAGIIYILAALEILDGIWRRSKEIVLLSVFPVTYFTFISSFIVRNDRTFLPLTPFLFLLAASLLVKLISLSTSLQGIWRRLFVLFVSCIAAIGLIFPISKTFTDTARLMIVDSRETARIWINHNLPTGSKIAIESYSPFVDPSRFSVHGFGRIIDYQPEWYLEQGFDYLIFSQGMYGRFYLEPERYKNQILEYEAFFKKFNIVKIFKDGGYEIRIYKIK